MGQVSDQIRAEQAEDIREARRLFDRALIMMEKIHVYDRRFPTVEEAYDGDGRRLIDFSVADAWKFFAWAIDDYAGTHGEQWDHDNS